MKLTLDLLKCQTVKDLKSFIRLSGYSGYSTMNKTQLINFILKNVVIDGMDAPSQPASIASEASEEYSIHNLKNVKLPKGEIPFIMQKIKNMYSCLPGRSFEKDEGKWLEIIQKTKFNEDYNCEYFRKSNVINSDRCELILFFQITGRIDEIFEKKQINKVLSKGELYLSEDELYL
jgi:hypothetical protein